MGKRHQRGVTMVSVMLLMVSMLTVGLLAVRTSVREVTQAGQLVARERAVMVAQAAVDLAAAQYVSMDNPTLNAALSGFAPQVACTNECMDCIPDPTDVVTGQRNDILSGPGVGCGGRPCMRQGAVAQLNDSTGTPIQWCDVPIRDLITAADPDARVTVWVRNNTADALGAAGSGDWIVDSDQVVVVTATATIRNTSVTVEQEIMLSLGAGVVVAAMSPDEGYGGGHNNDNSVVTVCSENAVEAEAVP